MSIEQDNAKNKKEKTISTAKEQLNKSGSLKSIMDILTNVFTSMNVNTDISANSGQSDIVMRLEADENSLYKQLVDGEFNQLSSDMYCNILARIIGEEGVPYSMLKEQICKYLEVNEPVGGYHIDIAV